MTLGSGAGGGSGLNPQYAGGNGTNGLAIIQY